MQWTDAFGFIACLNANAWLEYRDWRLPNRNELTSLVHYGQGDRIAWLESQGFTQVQIDAY